jgi:hypothetical protein
MKTKLFLLLGSLALLLVFPVQNASAISKSYTIGSWNATASDFDYDIDVYATPATFTLNDSGERTFNFFDITTDAWFETTSIDASINFTVPVQTVDIDGSTTFSFFFVPIYFTDLTPANVYLSGRTARVTLSEPSFVVSSIATVTATIKQLSSTVSSSGRRQHSHARMGFAILTYVSRRNLPLVNRVFRQRLRRYYPPGVTVTQRVVNHEPRPAPATSARSPASQECPRANDSRDNEGAVSVIMAAGSRPSK